MAEGDVQRDPIRPAEIEPVAYLRPVRSVGRDQLILDALAELVAKAGLKLGDPLPPERELAARLEVGRSTVREALKRWESLGIIEKRRGSGSYLAAAIDPASVHVPIAMKFEGQSLLRCLEVRRALELEVVVLAAENATDADIAEIRDKLEKLEEATTRYGHHPHREDAEFHHAIYRASGNPLFHQIIGQLHEAFHNVYVEPFGRWDIAMESYPLHRGLYEAIAAHDPAKARGVIDQIVGITMREVRKAMDE